MRVSFKEVIISFAVTVNILFLIYGYIQEDIYFALLGIMNLALFFVGYIINKQVKKEDE